MNFPDKILIFGIASLLFGALSYAITSNTNHLGGCSLSTEKSMTPTPHTGVIITH